MKNLAVSVLILIYIGASAFLEIEEGGRITPADLFLVGVMLVAIVSIVRRNHFILPSVHLAAVPMLLLMLVSALLAYYPARAAFELVVVLFSFLGSLAIVNLLVTMPEQDLRRFVRWYVVLIGSLSTLCLIDFLIMPGLVSSRALGGLQGPFRNTGQAGSFFGIHGVLILSLVVGKVVPRNSVYIGAIVATILALIFTIKRASQISFISGLILLALFLLLSTSARDKKIGAIFLVTGLIGSVFVYALFQWALEAVPGLRWRVDYKISGDALDSFQDGFIAENVASMISAVSDRPLFGVGLGNVMGVYQSHEIHSTYLGVVAYGGLLGTLAYGFFMLLVIKEIVKEVRYKVESSWAAFLYILLPLFFGQMIGWGYTYHIRKREFWIMVIFIVLAVHVSKRCRLARHDSDVCDKKPIYTKVRQL